MRTIIQKLVCAPEDKNDFFMKRDDLLPFSMGGNKVRIAEAFYQDMREKKCDCMIIYGSKHSNLCRVLSVLCYSRSTPCYMICSHEDGEEDKITNNGCLIDWTGTEVIHCRKTEIADAVGGLMDRLRMEGFSPYYIYGTKYGVGNEGAAAKAYAESYGEIVEYSSKEGITFDYIFCPSGTGATQSGLICGHLLENDKVKIAGVMISSREITRARQIILQGVQSYFKEYFPKYDLKKDLEDEVLLLDGYKKGGYGRYDEEIRKCIREEYCRNGIPLDPIYTAKAFWGMKQYLRENDITGKKILFLHTGGTPLFYDYLAG